MKTGIEYIKVFIKYDENGMTKCICKRSNKRCSEQCSPEIVERDKYRGWEKTFQRDKYGKTKIK